MTIHSTIVCALLALCMCSPADAQVARPPVKAQGQEAATKAAKAAAKAKAEKLARQRDKLEKLTGKMRDALLASSKAMAEYDRYKDYQSAPYRRRAQEAAQRVQEHADTCQQAQKDARPLIKAVGTKYTRGKGTWYFYYAGHWQIHSQNRFVGVVKRPIVAWFYEGPTCTAKIKLTVRDAFGDTAMVIEKTERCKRSKDLEMFEGLKLTGRHMEAPGTGTVEVTALKTATK